jgi:hypothetical protein
MSKQENSSVYSMTNEEIVGAVAIIYTHGNLTKQEYTKWVSSLCAQYGFDERSLLKRVEEKANNV